MIININRFQITKEEYKNLRVISPLFKERGLGGEYFYFEALIKIIYNLVLYLISN